MVYKKFGKIRYIDGLYGTVSLGKDCIHIIIPMAGVNAGTVDDSVIEREK